MPRSKIRNDRGATLFALVFTLIFAPIVVPVGGLLSASAVALAEAPSAAAPAVPTSPPTGTPSVGRFPSPGGGPLLTLPSQKNPTAKTKKGRRREQKETEGTEAPGRFEADTILKSPYSIDGQPLEVDPD